MWIQNMQSWQNRAEYATRLLLVISLQSASGASRYHLNGQDQPSQSKEQRMGKGFLCFMCSLCTSTQPFKNLLSCPQVSIDCHGVQNLPERKEAMGGFLGNPPNEKTVSGTSEMVSLFGLPLQPWTELKRRWIVPNITAALRWSH